MPNCSYCGTKILWGSTPDGKRVPLDPKAPVYHYDPAAKTAVIIPQLDYYRPVMVNHFSTCPKITRRGQGPVQHINVPPEAWFEQLAIEEGQVAILILGTVNPDDADYAPSITYEPVLEAARIGYIISEVQELLDERADAEQPDTLAQSWEEVAPKPVK